MASVAAMAAASDGKDVKSEPIEDKKESENKKTQVLALRGMKKAKLKAMMNQLLDANPDETRLANGFLTKAESKGIAERKFPVDKPVLAGYLTGGLRDRPVQKVDGKNFYCSNVAFFYQLSHIKYPQDDLTQKSAEWWKANYPIENEVSHLFDGVRSDINPNNLVMESHDINKSRIFCRLLFEKKEKELRAVPNTTEDAAYNAAKQFSLDCCTKLHNPQCKFLHPSVGRQVEEQLIRRRTQMTANAANTKSQKEKSKKRKKCKYILRDVDSPLTRVTPRCDVRTLTHVFAFSVFHFLFLIVKTHVVHDS